VFFFLEKSLIYYLIYQINVDKNGSLRNETLANIKRGKL